MSYKLKAEKLFREYYGDYDLPIIWRDNKVSTYKKVYEALYKRMNNRK